MTEQEANTDEAPRPAVDPDDRAEKPPRYEKPRLRRHDQIDQVRPYGPSEI